MVYEETVAVHVKVFVQLSSWSDLIGSLLLFPLHL